MHGLTLGTKIGLWVWIELCDQQELLVIQVELSIINAGDHAIIMTFYVYS